MTPATTLHLAKQGDPTAIATLMNRTLQPRGITATVEIRQGNLHILLASSRPLPQATLLDFMQKGLRKLGIVTFPRVRVSAYQTGEELPLWIEDIRIEEIPSPGSEAAANFGHRNWDERSAAVGAHQGRSRLWAGVGGLVCGSFVAGGLAAWLVPSSRPAVGWFPGSHANSTPAAERLGMAVQDAAGIPAQQAQAQAYLAKMNRAQRMFHAQNGRFAGSLEELERSAAVIARSDSYRYTLKVKPLNQAKLNQAELNQAELADLSDLIAIPQVDGLASFRAIALIPDEIAEAGPPKSLFTVICRSTMPTKIPPALPKTWRPPVQCPPDAALVTDSNR
jgi:Type IV pilin-like G and H, putative